VGETPTAAEGVLYVAGITIYIKSSNGIDKKNPGTNCTGIFYS
jgi:hypothetical protein